jgi:phosphoribosyl 1,2-cyclic phosphodiesterase
MREEFFPIPLETMGAKLNYLQDESELKIDQGVKIISTNHYHPGGATSYRVEAEGKAVVYTTDIEHGEGIDNRVVEIANDADLLIHDAQYTPEELKYKKGWGHSSWEQAIRVAELANVKQLIITHHDPEHNYEFLFNVEKECQKHFPNVKLAKDNMEIEL